MFQNYFLQKIQASWSSALCNILLETQIQFNKAIVAYDNEQPHKTGSLVGLAMYEWFIDCYVNFLQTRNVCGKTFAVTFEGGSNRGACVQKQVPSSLWIPTPLL